MSKVTYEYLQNMSKSSFEYTDLKQHNIKVTVLYGTTGPGSMHYL